jgi:hypothetical protein
MKKIETNKILQQYLSRLVVTFQKPNAALACNAPKAVIVGEFKIKFLSN